jgi:hypothetical protein
MGFAQIKECRVVARAGLKAGGVRKGIFHGGFYDLPEFMGHDGLYGCTTAQRKLPGVDIQVKFVVASSDSTPSVNASFFSDAEKKGHFLCLSRVQYSSSSKMLGI